MEIRSAEKGKFESKWLENVRSGEGFLFIAYMWLFGIALLLIFTIWNIYDKSSLFMILMIMLLLFVLPILLLIFGGHPPSYSLAEEEGCQK